MAKSTTEKVNTGFLGAILDGGTKSTDTYHTVITDENGDRHDGYGNSSEESGRVASRRRDLDTNNPWYSSGGSGSSSSSHQSNSSGLESVVESSPSSGYGGSGSGYASNRSYIQGANLYKTSTWRVYEKFLENHEILSSVVVSTFWLAISALGFGFTIMLIKCAD